VTAIEALGQTKNRRQRLNRLPLTPAQSRVLLVPPVGCGPAMIACNERNGFDFVRLEAPQITVPDQIVRVLVVALVRDEDADVVKERRVLEPLTLAIGEGVTAPRLVEERHGDPCHLAGVLRPVVAPLGELDDAPAADVGVAVCLRNLFAVPRDVVEDESFSQREIAQRDFVGSQPLENRVEQDRPRGRQIGATGIEAGNAEPLLHGQ
jgi:hypothetical protein